MLPAPKTILSIALLALVAACAGPGPRHGPPDGARGSIPLDNGGFMKPGALLFAVFDTNQDYTLSSQELDAGLDIAFTRADADHSGALSLFEYQNWAGRALGSPTALPAWMTVDKNDDTSITREEFRAAFRSLADGYGLTASSGLRLSALTMDTAEVIANNTRRSGREGGGEDRRRPSPQGPGPDPDGD